MVGDRGLGKGFCEAGGPGLGCGRVPDGGWAERTGVSEEAEGRVAIWAGEDSAKLQGQPPM